MKAPVLFLLTLGMAAAQVPNPPQRPLGPSETGQPGPVIRVTVVSRTIKAVNYNRRTGGTKIDFRGTELMPSARGEARVESQMGSTKIETKLERMTPASQFGPEYMTYVLWAITPEGRANNLGEVVLQGDHAKLLSTTVLQSFGLMVTAEPYFAVTQPSDVVAAENFLREDTTGTIQPVEAKYQLLQRGQYVLNRAQYQPVTVDPKGPLQLAEAENAVELARQAGADHYAGETLGKAQTSLQNARGFLKSKDRKRSETNAREAVQMAEDARIITFRRMREEALANERAAAAAREAEAQEQARLSAETARQEQKRRARAEADRRAAEQAAAVAQQASLLAAQEKAAADAARADAIAQQQAARQEADRARQATQQAEALRAQAEAEKAQLRERLRQQFSMILETRESARGLIVNINDVLFDFNKYTLKPGAREKLAKVAGILLAYPGLKVQLEGHTDSVGGEEYNKKLSEERAGAVRDYLTSQGVPPNALSAVGLGEASPVASNDTASGRQQNRRVEMVVSGDPIGTAGIQQPASTGTNGGAIQPPRE